MVKLNELLIALLGYKKIGNENPDIHSIEMDSRLVKEGSLFICIKGYTVDGHDYATRAIENGAVALLSEYEIAAKVPVIIVKDTKRAMAVLANAFYEHPTKDLTLIGVTGTNGKTTTTHLIEKILNDYGKKTGLIGTMYTKIDKDVFETKNTTPESLTLQKYFSQMKNASVDAAIMEVSSHALHLGRVRGCDFNIAVFMNLTPDHLDYHKTMEEYRFAKGLLFAQLGNTYDNNNLKLAIFNADDPASIEYDKITTAQTLTFGIDNPCDIRAKNISITPTGTTYTLETAEAELKIQLKLIGKFSVYNALAATAVAQAYGVPLEQIKASLESIAGVDGRFEPVDEGQPYTVIVDYAHTADSLENILQTVNEFAEGRIICVVGCGGDRDKTKRPIMASIAVRVADLAVFTSDNPRSEDPAEILKDMEQGVNAGEYVKIIDRSEAINFAIKQAAPKDVVVIAGKGHETYQIIGDKTFDFDDRLIAREAIRGRV